MFCHIGYALIAKYLVFFLLILIPYFPQNAFRSDRIDSLYFHSLPIRPMVLWHQKTFSISKMDTVFLPLPPTASIHFWLIPSRYISNRLEEPCLIHLPILLSSVILFPTYTLILCCRYRFLIESVYLLYFPIQLYYKIPSPSQ